MSNKITYIELLDGIACRLRAAQNHHIDPARHITDYIYSLIENRFEFIYDKHED